MTSNEIINSSSRSEGAKRAWEKRKAKQMKNENTIPMQAPMKAWIYHTEWIGLMATIIACFIFVHNESVHVSDRLDNHMEAINRRADESNKRTDELHKEFYDLLKETRK